MNSMPLVSVIVASYNYQNLIRKTLDSLLAQTYSNIEIIVVDDGSSDNSVQVITEYVEKNKNVFLYTHPNRENKGLSATLQEGLKHCHGEWIAFCESDDWYMPTNIEEKIKLSHKNPKLGLIVNAVQLEGGTIWDKRYIWWTYRILRKNHLNWFKFFTPNLIIVTFSTIMIKKSILEMCDFNTPVKPWLDFWLWRQVAFQTQIGFVDRKLTNWLKHPESYIAREKAENLNKLRSTFLRASDDILRKRYPLSFLWRRYSKYIFGIDEYVDYINYNFLGISVLSICNTFLPPDAIRYKFKLFKLIPLLVVRRTLDWESSLKWRLNDAD